MRKKNNNIENIFEEDNELIINYDDVVKTFSKPN